MPGSSCRPEVEATYSLATNEWGSVWTLGCTRLDRVASKIVEFTQQNFCKYVISNRRRPRVHAARCISRRHVLTIVENEKIHAIFGSKWIQLLATCTPSVLASISMRHAGKIKVAAW